MPIPYNCAGLVFTEGVAFWDLGELHLGGRNSANNSDNVNNYNAHGLNISRQVCTRPLAN